MRIRILAATVLLIAAIAAYADKPKAIYKVTRLSVSQVGISCLNGADPTGNKVGDMVIMSCTCSKQAKFELTDPDDQCNDADTPKDVRDSQACK